MPQSRRPEVNPFAVQCTLNLCIATPQKKRTVGLIEFHWRLGSLAEWFQHFDLPPALTYPAVW